ncbi:MAG: methyltransferase domain-containing protein [Chloroflexi bacterium]|nr:methyltransferase domain-containing protein [Chloroflexota bacterium]
MAQNDSHYVPAFGLSALTPYYDSFAKLVNPYRRRLIHHAKVQPGQRVLDVGRGTGLLTMMVKQAVPEARVTGLDGDPQVLEIARENSRGADIQWDHALAFDMPYPGGSFDAAVSSFVTHHLTSADKVRAFKEVRRVLRPDGWFFILDFGPPFNFLTRIQASVMKYFELTADNFNGRIMPMLAEAGFAEVEEAERFVIPFGPLSLWRAGRGIKGSRSLVTSAPKPPRTIVQ